MSLDFVIESCLPMIISVLELMGIFVVTWSALHAFWEYLLNTFGKRHYNLQFELANGLAVGLEFKMAAEILKTVLVRQMSELLILGAVIILRALLSLLIHFELKREKPSTPPQTGGIYMPQIEINEPESNAENTLEKPEKTPTASRVKKSDDI